MEAIKTLKALDFIYLVGIIGRSQQKYACFVPFLNKTSILLELSNA